MVQFDRNRKEININQKGINTDKQKDINHACSRVLESFCHYCCSQSSACGNCRFSHPGFIHGSCQCLTRQSCMAWHGGVEISTADIQNTFVTITVQQCVVNSRVRKERLFKAAKTVTTNRKILLRFFSPSRPFNSLLCISLDGPKRNLLRRFEVIGEVLLFRYLV